jgi:hypothetical protein
VNTVEVVGFKKHAAPRKPAAPASVCAQAARPAGRARGRVVLIIQTLDS